MILKCFRDVGNLGNYQELTIHFLKDLRFRTS